MQFEVEMKKLKIDKAMGGNILGNGVNESRHIVFSIKRYTQEIITVESGEFNGDFREKLRSYRETYALFCFWCKKYRVEGSGYEEVILA